MTVNTDGAKQELIEAQAATIEIQEKMIAAYKTKVLILQHRIQDLERKYVFHDHTDKAPLIIGLYADPEKDKL